MTARQWAILACLVALVLIISSFGGPLWWLYAAIGVLAVAGAFVATLVVRR